MTAAAAGYWAALPMVVGIAGSLTIPRLATPERRFTIVMLLCMAASVASLALLTTEPVVLTGALLLQGLVRSSLMTVLVLTLMELPQIDARHAGTASGLFFSAAEIGGVLGPLGLGVVFDISGGFDAGLYLLAALTAATSGNAEMLGLDREIGRIAPGYLADIAIVAGNPAADIATVRRMVAVYQAGECVASSC